MKGMTLRLALAATAAALTMATAARAQAQCAGDCNGNNAVAINELIVGVNIALGSAEVTACASFDTNSNGAVAINELIAAVNRALNGCPPPGDTPTPTPTVSVDTPTATPTTGNSTCGNDVVETAEGETCDDGNTADGDDCPSDCRIAACARSGETLSAEVTFASDTPELLLAGLNIFMQYPDGVVDIPGSAGDAAVQAAVTSTVFSVTPNDRNYGLTAVMLDPLLFGVPPGTALSVTFDRCTGAPLPPASAFQCTVVDATDINVVTVTDQVTCAVVLP